jgi:hypothetical protein
LCREVLRSFSSTGELCLFTVFHILTSLASWWCMSPKQSGRVLFAVCVYFRSFPAYCWVSWRIQNPKSDFLSPALWTLFESFFELLLLRK